MIKTETLPQSNTVTLQGKILHLKGILPQVGFPLPNLTLVDQNMEEVLLSRFWDKPQVLITVPSLDTPTCQKETKTFHDRLAKRTDLHSIVVSMDLPFAQKRWCGMENIQGLHLLSDFKFHSVAHGLGLQITELGILARAVLLIDQGGILRSIQVVPELSDEPNYEEIMAQITAWFTSS